MLALIQAALMALILSVCGHPVAAAPVSNEIDWPAVLADCDMVWGSLPKKWDEAPFLGNGEQGTLMYKLNNTTLRWDVGCSAAHEHRPIDEDDLKEKNVATLNRGRHFIGHLEVRFPAELTGSQSRLDLWNAEATGTLRSAGGNATWTTLVHATQPVMRFDLTTKGNLAGTGFTYVPEEARNPRSVRAKTPRSPANPPPVLSKLSDGVQTAVHNLVAGGQTAVAWLQQDTGDTKQLWLSVRHSFPGTEATKQAVTAVRAAAKADQARWVQGHRDWWHALYSSSFISTGDPYWDSFYWVQQYKLASSTRDKGWIVDNQGPWLQPTAWCAIWWNLNAQLSHSSGYTANRRGTISALSHRLDINRDNLSLNVAEPYRADSYAIGRNTSNWDLLGHAGEPGGRKDMDRSIGRECGDLLWALHNIDLEYRYWMDTELRDQTLYPLLRRAVNYYRHFLVKKSDGLYHLPSTHSPEFRNVEDCTYDIDLLHWAVGRLLELAAEQGISGRDEPLIKVWTDLNDHLVPAHVNETGRMLGKGAPLNGGHRHWSHLLAIYPLRTLTPEAANDRKLIEKSLARWHSFGRGIAGYAFTGASCMSSLLGNGDESLRYLNILKSYVKPNTMYSEIGLPVMETPIHGATAIQEMLLQSWGGRLRVFAAVPSAWPDTQIHQLRGEGAYLVSARREQGKTRWVLVHSEVGGTVDVEPQISGAKWLTSPGVTVKTIAPGIYRVTMAPGDKVLFQSKADAGSQVVIKPVDRRGKLHRLGLPKGYSGD